MNTPVSKHKCPKNYEGPSKSMEVQAILELTIEAWESGIYAIGTIVSDDDTTMKAQLKHSYKQLIAANKMTNESWPRNKSKQKKADNGRLPLEITPPKFQADPNHRKKVIGKMFYELASMPKKQAWWTKHSHFG